MILALCPPCSLLQIPPPIITPPHHSSHHSTHHSSHHHSHHHSTHPITPLIITPITTPITTPLIPSLHSSSLPSPLPSPLHLSHHSTPLIITPITTSIPPPIITLSPLHSSSLFLQVGVFATRGGELSVVEYSELSPEQVGRLWSCKFFHASFMLLHAS